MICQLLPQARKTVFGIQSICRRWSGAKTTSCYSEEKAALWASPTAIRGKYQQL